MLQNPCHVNRAFTINIFINITEKMPHELSILIKLERFDMKKIRI